MEQIKGMRLTDNRMARLENDDAKQKRERHIQELIDRRESEKRERERLQQSNIKEARQKFMVRIKVPQ